jgi:hypothetical protein
MGFSGARRPRPAGISWAQIGFAAIKACLFVLHPPGNFIDLGHFKNCHPDPVEQAENTHQGIHPETIAHDNHPVDLMVETIIIVGRFDMSHRI